MWPQIIYLLFVGFALGITIMAHGERRTVSLGHFLVGHAFVLSLLYWGGFFDCFFK